MEGVKELTADSSKIGLVFSSGFFGFFAHAGFLAAIRELEITPVGYAGSSSGAIVAAMAASGMDDHAIREMLFSVRKEDFWDPDPWHVILKKATKFFRGYSGYLKGEKFARLLERIPARRFEDCETPLAIAATNLTEKKGTVFTRGNLVKAIQASGAVPMLFKPVEIDGSLYVDGGVVDKAPLKAIADLVDLDKIIIHFIASGNVGKNGNGFLEKRMSPWHVQYLAVNIARQEAYERQLEILDTRGVEVIEVKTDAPAVGPNKLNKGPAAYETAKAAALKILSNLN
jgi:NTE family protein